MIEKDKIVYPRDGIDELFEMYPKSFKKQSKSLLKTAEKLKTKLITKIRLRKLCFLMVDFIKLVF